MRSGVGPGHKPGLKPRPGQPGAPGGWDRGSGCTSSTKALDETLGCLRASVCSSVRLAVMRHSLGGLTGVAALSQVEYKPG